MASRLKFVVLLFAVLLASCAGSSGQIGTNLTLCCPGNYGAYNDYSVEVVNVPIFLRDYLVTEFDTAFQEKGLSRDDQDADLRVVLRFNQVNLEADQEQIDPFERVETMNTTISYIAAIEIEISEAASGDSVYAGSINRIHQVAPGEYMHEDRARTAFLQAFRAVLASYPPLPGGDSAG